MLSCSCNTAQAVVARSPPFWILWSDDGRVTAEALGQEVGQMMTCCDSPLRSQVRKGWWYLRSEYPLELLETIRSMMPLAGLRGWEKGGEGLRPVANLLGSTVSSCHLGLGHERDRHKG